MTGLTNICFLHDVTLWNNNLISHRHVLQAGDADSSRTPGLTSGTERFVNVHCAALLLCHSDSASVLLYFTFNKLKTSHM